MAYDKVVDSAALDAGLKQIADAIRGKTGASDSLDFPVQMAEAIAAIQAGGGSGTITTGTITPTEASQTFTIEHGLGKVPSEILVAHSVANNSIPGANTLHFAYFNGSYAWYAYKVSSVYISSASYNWEEDGRTSTNAWRVVGLVTDKSFYFGQTTSSTTKLNASTTYRWIAIG